MAFFTSTMTSFGTAISRRIDSAVAGISGTASDIVDDPRWIRNAWLSYTYHKSVHEHLRSGCDELVQAVEDALPDCPDCGCPFHRTGEELIACMRETGRTSYGPGTYC